MGFTKTQSIRMVIGSVSSYHCTISVISLCNLANEYEYAKLLQLCIPHFFNCKVRSNGSYNTITEINNTGNPKDSIFIKGKHASLYAIPTSEITFYDFPGREQVERKKPTNVIAWAAQKGASPDDTALVGQLSLEDKNTAFPYGTITFPDGTVWTRIWDSYGLIQG